MDLLPECEAMMSILCDHEADREDKRPVLPLLNVAGGEFIHYLHLDHLLGHLGNFVLRRIFEGKTC